MNWLRKMMAGRYGSDQFGLALVIISIIITVATMFIPVPWIGYLSLIPLVFAIYRMFSKQIQRRQQENMAFMRFWYKIKNFFRNFKTNLQERKTYRFYKCSECGQKVRVPKGKGKINITCPKCKNKFIRST